MMGVSTGRVNGPSAQSCAQAGMQSRLTGRIRRRRYMGLLSRKWVPGTQLGNDDSCGIAGLVAAVGWEADGADACVPPAAVAFADLGEIDHVFSAGLGPRIRADSDLSTEAGFRKPYGVGRLRVEVVRDEFVEAFELMIGDVEKDGAVAVLGSFADE